MWITFRDIDDAILSGYTVTYVTACVTTILRRDKIIAALMKVRFQASFHNHAFCYKPALINLEDDVERWLSHDLHSLRDRMQNHAVSRSGTHEVSDSADNGFITRPGIFEKLITVNKNLDSIPIPSKLVTRLHSDLIVRIASMKGSTKLIPKWNVREILINDIQNDIAVCIFHRGNVFEKKLRERYKICLWKSSYIIYFNFYLYIHSNFFIKN